MILLSPLMLLEIVRKITLSSKYSLYSQWKEIRINSKNVHWTLFNEIAINVYDKLCNSLVKHVIFMIIHWPYSSGVRRNTECVD